ncbi:MAG: type II secretion system protein [Planctomycetaceae bacterium]
MNRQHHNMIKRQGFTLLELLIVVAIVGTLMSLSVVVMYGFVNQAEEEATSATIQKINRLLEERIDAFDRAFKEPTRMSRFEICASAGRS